MRDLPTTRRPISQRRLKRAIAIVEESRFSHQRAIYEPEYESTGSPAFHRQAIAEYEEVLEVLHRMEAWLRA